MTAENADAGSGLRQRSRALFAELAEAEPGSAEQQRIRAALVEMHLPLAEHSARRFANRGEPYEDLLQVGTIGLINAVDRFDLGRGLEFSTYATPTIIGEIKRHFRDKGWAVRVPRRLQELRISISHATADLSQQFGRSPTAGELAERLGVEVEEVLEAIESGNAYAALSLDAGGPDNEDAPGPILETVGEPDSGIEEVELRESLHPMIRALPERERKIITLRFFNGMTQSQIAAQVGLSQMHVSRILARTLAELRASMESDEPIIPRRR